MKKSLFNIHKTTALFLSYFSLIIVSAAQDSEKTKIQYFKDIEIDKNQIKYEFNQSTANSKSLKCNLIITNQSDKYLIIDGIDIYATLGTEDIKVREKYNDLIIVEPNNKKKFELAFKGLDFRNSNVNIHIEKTKTTDSVAAIYNFKDIPLIDENQRRSGPVTWTLVHKDFDILTGIRVTGKLKYTGDKFLEINLQNAALHTIDGGEFFNIGEQGGLITTYNNKFYNKHKRFEKEVLFFNAKKIYLKPEKKTTFNLSGVFKELSTKDLDGLNVHLTTSEHTTK